MLEASLLISENLPEGTRGLWAVVHCATWVALGELEWVPFPVLRKSIDINLLGMENVAYVKLFVCNCNFHRCRPFDTNYVTVGTSS